jgi:hypothetical protein
MSDKTLKAPAPKPGQSPFERMTELTRRVIGVPKSEAVKPKKALRRHR